MGKSVMLLSLLGTILLFSGGLVDPNSPIMWMASVDPIYQVLRGTVIIILVTLLLTEPPRNIVFRIFVGFASLVATGWALEATYSNQMQLLDTMTILLASITSWIAILERGVEEETNATPVRHIPIKQIRRIAIN